MFNLLVIPLSYIFIFVGVGIVLSFIKKDKGPKEPILALWAAFGFGILALVVTTVLSLWFANKQVTEINNLHAGFFLMLKVGFIEEFSKFVPLAIFIYHKSYFDEHNDGIIYFAICGMTFGVIENIMYTFTMGPATGVARLVLTPFFHASTVAIVGYYLAKKKIDKESWVKVVIAFVSVALLHATYNFGFLSKMPLLVIVSFCISVLLTLSIFLYYYKANQEDRAEGISASGPDNFCEHCGFKNGNSTLYCEHCGLKY